MVVILVIGKCIIHVLSFFIMRIKQINGRSWLGYIIPPCFMLPLSAPQLFFSGVRGRAGPLVETRKRESSPSSPSLGGGGSTREEMSRPWLLPIGRLHRLAGRELAAGCRSRPDSALADLICCCKTFTSLEEDTVGCTDLLVQAIAPFKDGSPAVKDFTYAPMHTEESSRIEVGPQYTVGFSRQEMNAALVKGSHPMEAIANLNGVHTIKAIADLKGVAGSCSSAEMKYLKYKLTISSVMHATSYGLNLSATKKAISQNVPLLARRCFSSDSGSVQKSIIFGSGDRVLFEKNLACASKERQNRLDLPSLKAEFANHYRPVFAANCLLLPTNCQKQPCSLHGDCAFPTNCQMQPCSLHDDCIPYLHGPIHGLTKHWPIYLTALDVMIRIKSCRNDEVKHLVDYIVQSRIIIAEVWDDTYENIELVRYDPSSDTSFVRAECDASFEKLKGEDDSGFAKVALLIWKGTDLIYVDVIEGLESPDSVGAEILAALALLIKCKELGFQKVELWSDSKRVCGVLSGSERRTKTETIA